MAEFTAACQAARDAFQRALDAYDTARDAHLGATAELARKVEALGRARRRAADAQAALAAANTAWDAHVAGIRAAPALGVTDVEAGVQPPNAPPAGAAVAGPVQSRTPPNFNIWSVGPPPDRSAWAGAADRALRRAVALRAAAGRAESQEAQASADLAVAVAAEAAARAAEQRARAARTAASDTGTAARARALTVCAGQTATRPLGGGEFEVGPGVAPRDERRVREKLDSLPAPETTGLGGVEIKDKLGPESAGSVFGRTAGQYVVGTGVIQLFIFGHTEITLKHEVGHHVHLARLSQAARDRWKTFYETGNNGKPPPTGKMPTEYAGTDEGEGFAEVYEYLRDGKTLDPDVKRLMESLLGELA